MYPPTLAPSPAAPVKSVGIGIYCQIFETTGLSPIPRGSHKLVPHCAGWYVTPPTVTAVGLRLYGWYWPLASATWITPARSSAEGEFFSIVPTLGKRLPS